MLIKVLAIWWALICVIGFTIDAVNGNLFRTRK